MALEKTQSSDSAEVDYTFKIVLLGDPSVGKTSLAKRYVDNMFRIDYIMTIGMDVRSKIIYVQDKKVKLVIWDLGGQEFFKDVREAYCKGANGAIIVFDLTRIETFLHLHDWQQTLWNIAGKLPLAICANKFDLKNLRKISRERALDIVRFSGSENFETSAKTGENVAKAFLFITETILKDKKGVLIFKGKAKDYKPVGKMGGGMMKPKKAALGALMGGIGLKKLMKK